MKTQSIYNLTHTPRSSARTTRWMHSLGVGIILACGLPFGLAAAENWMFATPVALPAPVKVSADFPALGSFLLFARNKSEAREYQSSRIFQAEVIPNLTVLRANSLDPKGTWRPVTATFTKMSADVIQSEVIISSLTEAFYRVDLASEGGSVHIESSERAGNKLRLRYRWIK